MKKRCAKCRVEKPYLAFAKRFRNQEDDAAWCERCVQRAHHTPRGHPQSRQRQPRYELAMRFRELIQAAKSAPCVDCGQHYPHYVMDLDHVTGNKKFNVGQAAQHTISEEVLLDEIAKCEVVCSNCHRERTWRRSQQNN